MAQSSNNQTAFWEAMKEKYERRNENLKQQEICLRQRLDQLKQLMEKQQGGEDCDCVPEKLEKPNLVQCLVEKGKNLFLGSCKCDDPKTEEKFLCACHITDPNTPLNIDIECPMQGPSENPIPEGCLNSTCDFYNPQLAGLADDPSTFSLRTTDIYYMDKLADLVKAEKNMQEKIEDLEQREHSYITAIRDLQEVMNKKPEDDRMRREFHKMEEVMEEENKKLKNELENLRLELKHCFERVEGPLKRSLEDQKGKCSKMENKLKDLQTKIKNREDNHMKEINEIKAKLCQACCTMVDLNTVNSKLKDDLGSLENKCASLEDELLTQQLKEAENILKFKNALSRRHPTVNIQNRGDDSEQDLEHIARKLSETLKEVCPCVTSVPSGLTETVKNIKQLTELVGQKGAQHRKKRKGKKQTSTDCSCLFDEGVKATENIIPKPRLTDSFSSPSASLRPFPTISFDSIRSEKEATKRDSEGSSSSSRSFGSSPLPINLRKPMKDKTIAKSEKQSTKPTSKEPVKETSSKCCACCPAQDFTCSPPRAQPQKIEANSVETNCSCTDIQTKRTGPSEEVIAVKDLGTLGSSQAGEMVVQALKKKQKSDRLEVDTTCDVLDVPPKDIHVITTIAKTGSLEITTEGPPGIIETKVNYLPDGKIEIVTKLIDHNKMDTFLDGTLLNVPSEIQCNESQTCGGQCDATSGLSSNKTTRPEEDCDHGKAGEDQFDKNGKQVVSNIQEMTNEEKNETRCTPYQQFIVNNNFILLNGEGTNPFRPGEWKNTRFEDKVKEEFEPTNMMSSVRQKFQENIEDEKYTPTNEDLPEVFRLSSRPSLTDVEKYLQDAHEDYTPRSSVSLIFPDVLETISEGDEEEDSTRTDFGQSAEQIFGDAENCKEDARSLEGERNNISSNNEVKDTTERVIIQDNTQLNKAIESNEETHDEDANSENVLKILQSTSYKEQENSLASTKEMVKSSTCDSIDSERADLCSNVSDISSTKTVINLPLQISSSTCLKVVLKSSLPPEDKKDIELECNDLWRKISDKSDPFEELSSNNSDAIFEINLEKRSSESICKLYRNFGNINLLTGNFQLKQSKSMYERKSNGIECLRVCKSAVLSLGSLKIDLEKFKFLSREPTIGDFDEKTIDLEDKLALAVLCPFQERKETCYLKTVEAFFKEDIREGPKSLESPEMIPDQTYQCYMCSCSKTNEQKDESEDSPSRRNDNLEQRIDRLLEVNPLTVSHGRDCQCIDCLVNNAQRSTTASSGQRFEDCRCSTKLQEITKEVDPSHYTIKCKPKKIKSHQPIPTEKVQPLYGSPNHQGDSLPHDENCTCVDCICNPCHFKKDLKSIKGWDCTKCDSGTCCVPTKNELASMELFQLGQPPEITVMNVRLSCDCGGKCPCSPCMDASRNPKKISKPQIQAQPSQKAKGMETPCKRCNSRVPDPPQEPSTCNCGGKCPCSPCMDDSQKPKQPSKPQIQTQPSQKVKGQETPCKRCQSRVPDGPLQQPTALPQSKRADIKSDSSRITPKQSSPDQPVDGPVNNTETWKNVVGCPCGPPPSDKKEVCDCKVCECKPCMYPEKARKSCDCKPAKKDPKGDKKGNFDCCCKSCTCVFCSDLNVSKPLDKPMANNEAIIPETEKTIKEKKIPLPTIDNKPVPQEAGDLDDSSPTTKCDCKNCECNPCIDRSQTEEKLVHDAIKEYMDTINKPEYKFDNIVGCDCAQCKCDTRCSGRVEENSINPAAASQLQPASGETNSTIEGQSEALIGDTPTKECNCQKCECNPCIDSSKTEKQLVHNAMQEYMDTLHKPVYKFDNIVRCDCLQCKCEVLCPGKIQTSHEETKANEDINGPSEPLIVVSQAQGDQMKPCCPCTGDRGNNDVLMECKDCLVCPVEEESTKNDQKMIEKEHPCDCSLCSCELCPDPNFKKIPTIGDADRAKKEIENVLNKIGTVCDQAEDNFKPLLRQASNFETTVSKMKLKLNNLQQKCKDKDQIINAMTNDLRIRSQSGVFSDLLKDLAHPKQQYIPDFTRTYVCDYLPRPRQLSGAELPHKKSSSSRFDKRLEPILELDRYLPGTKEDACLCHKNLDVSGMEIIDIRRVTIDSILIKWRCPSNISGISGYQIFVNDELKYKVLSPNRTNAVLDSLELSSSLEIMIFAMTLTGRCEPPALATYKI